MGGGKKEEKKGGKEAVLDWLEGGGGFFKTIRGLVCAFANGITLTK